MVKTRSSSRCFMSSMTFCMLPVASTTIATSRPTLRRLPTYFPKALSSEMPRLPRPPPPPPTPKPPVPAPVDAKRAPRSVPAPSGRHRPGELHHGTGASTVFGFAGCGMSDRRRACAPPPGPSRPRRASDPAAGRARGGPPARRSGAASPCPVRRRRPSRCRSRARRRGRTRRRCPTTSKRIISNSTAWTSAEMPTKVSVRPGRARVVESRTTGGGDMKREATRGLTGGTSCCQAKAGAAPIYQRSLARSARACVRLTATSLPAWSRMTSL